MRLVTLVTATAIMGYWAGNPHVVSWKASQQAQEEERVAIELSCADVEPWMQPECREDLAQEFASGSTTPDSILRLHCTSFDNVWEIHRTPNRPDLCEDFVEAAFSS